MSVKIALNGFKELYGISQSEAQQILNEEYCFDVKMMQRF